MKKSIHFFLNHWFIACFSAILFVGFLLRFYRFGEIPTSLYWDETAILVDAKSIAQTGYDMHGKTWLQAMFASYGDYKLPLYIWMAALSVKIFSVSEFSLRLPSAILGSLQIALIGYYVYLLFPVVKNNTFTKLAILSTSAVLALTPWSILFSRTGFEGFTGQFLLLCSAICLQLHFRNTKFSPKMLWMFLSIFLGALSVYSYYSVRFVWPVVFSAAWLFFDLWPKWVGKIGGKVKSIFLFFLSIILWLIFILPLSRSPFYQPSQQFRLSASSILSNDYAIESNILRETAGNDFLSRFFYHRHILLIKALVENYSSHLNLNYLFLNGDSNLRHSTRYAGLFQWWMVIGLVVGLYQLVTKKTRQFLFLFIWWMIALLPASVPTTVPHSLRSLNALSPITIIIGYGFAKLIKFVNSYFQIKFKYLVRISLLVMMMTSIPFIHDYYQHYPLRSSYDWQDGYKQLAVFVDQKKSEYTNIWINPDDDRLYLWLMAFGNYNGKDYQSWKSDNYQFFDIENIHFRQFYWERLMGIDGKILVITKPGQLEKEPQKYFEISDSLGVVRFVAGEYSN